MHQEVSQRSTVTIKKCDLSLGFDERGFFGELGIPLAYYHGYPPGKVASLSGLASVMSVSRLGICGGVEGSRKGRGGHGLRSPPVSVSRIELAHGLCSWLGILSGLRGGGDVHVPPLERCRHLWALCGLSGERGRTLGT